MNNVRRKLFTEDSSKEVAEPRKHPYYPKKQYFCIYCKSLKTNLARHFELCHRDETDVLKFLLLPKGDPERNQIIKKIRLRGGAYYNKFNPNSPIVARIDHKRDTSERTEVLPCPKCKEVHKSRYVVRNARGKCVSVHRLANQTLVKKILPPMRHDLLFNIVRNDKLIIAFGNHLTPKYIGHQEYIIRNRLRTLARYFQKVKTLFPEIKQLHEMFTPRRFTLALEAVKLLAGFNVDTSTYEHPKMALEMVQYLKICCRILNSYYIETENKKKELKVQKFSTLLNANAAGAINKPAHRDLGENKRKKILNNKIVIPLSADINKFKDYLLDTAEKQYQTLNTGDFNFNNWKILAEVCLLYLVVYNRKRSGETQKILKTDYDGLRKISDTPLPEMLTVLTDEERQLADTIYKITIRGKLDRPVDILIPQKVKAYVDKLCELREAAKVRDDNMYLFGLPGALSGGRSRVIETCAIMRKYTLMANLDNPLSVRSTLLRKHLATKVSTKNLLDAQRETVQDFMGHEDMIHRRIYRQQTVKNDLLMADLLNEEIQTQSANINEETDRTISRTLLVQLNKIDEGDQSNTTSLQCDVIDCPVSTSQTKQSPDRSKSKNKKPSKGCIISEGESSGSDEEFLPEMEKQGRKQRNSRDSDSEAEININKSVNIIKKKPWSTPERKIARNLFCKAFDERKNPSLAECRKAISENSELRDRTAAQLKAWVVHQIKLSETANSTRLRCAWRTPEKYRIMKLFGKHLGCSTYPSQLEMEEACTVYPELRFRNAEKIRSFLQYLKRNQNYTN